MKRMAVLLVMILLTCSACTALPAEERAFAVALCVEKAGETWRVHGRIPTYQTGGGYLTVSGDGVTLSAALSAMEAAAPMHLHLSQLRLLVLDEALGQTEELMLALHEFADRPDMRLHCAVAVTSDPAKDVAEALKPSTGARLSKLIDVQLDTRIEQGTLLPATLADVIRMGERQGPVLMALSLEEGAVSLAGGYPLTADMRLAQRLTQEETMLLALMLGHADAVRISLDQGQAQVREAGAKVKLGTQRQSAQVELSLRMTSGSFTPDGLAQALADAAQQLLSRLSSQGCDVLGLGRKAVMGMQTMSQWHGLDWASMYRNLQWTVSVKVQGAA